MKLETTYMGLKLKNPLVPSASPLSKEISNIRHMEDVGASAVVLESLFEEQISHESQELDYFLTQGTESYAEALSYFPDSEVYDFGPDEYLKHLSNAKEAVDIPIIASLNGVSIGGWIDYAQKLENAGADAIELNSYYLATNPEISSQKIEDNYVEILKAVKSSVKIPVAYKLSPFFTSMSAMAKRFDEAGADALVLFNRFYQPDIDLENLDVIPNIVLSTSHSMRLPLRWIAILYGKIEASLGATRGIHEGTDAIKMLMVGADVTMVCSELLRNGIKRISGIISEMTKWMEENEYESVEQMKGSMSYKSVAEPAAYSRANYMKALKSYI
ncbi:MAG: dihydroorotate dehydrogenase-like protein [Calditrichia bacterium]|nr:dihydroorotate dehydrogenase-like protein [Calditrichia bacterium]